MAEPVHEQLKDSASQTKAAAQSTAQAAERTKDSADRRTELAADRTVFAAERTYAAWVRTGLVALASGIGARKLLEGLVPGWMIVATGTALVLFSAFCFVAGVWRQLFVGAPPPNRVHTSILFIPMLGLPAPLRSRLPPGLAGSGSQGLFEISPKHRIADLHA